MNLQGSPVCGSNKPVVHQGDLPHRDGYLRTLGLKPTGGKSLAGELKLGHTARSQRCAQTRAQKLSQAGDAPIGKGADADPLDRTRPQDELCQWFHRAVGLGVDVETGVGERLQQVGHGADLAGAADPGGANLVPGQVGDDTGVVGDPVQLVVVERHQHAIGGDMHISLKVPVPQLHSGGEGPDGVFGGIAGTTAMGKCEWEGMVKERMRRRHAAHRSRHDWHAGARWGCIAVVIASDIKRCLGQMAEGVQVVTAAHDGVVRGYTSHWVSQVSFTDPIVMASVSPRHDTWPLIAESGRFAVSLLAGDQVEQGQYFSYPGRRFERLLTDYLVDEDPWWVVDGCIAWLGCEVIAIHESVGGGQWPTVDLDHRLVFARVVDVGEGRLTEPALVYSSRQGWRVASSRARQAGESVRDGLLARVEQARNQQARNQQARNQQFGDAG